MSPTPLPPAPAPIAILGVPFDNVTTDETIERISRMIASRKPHYLATANVDFVVQAHEDVELRRILLDAHLVLCDGMPLVWASRWLGNRLRERVTGSDLVPRLLLEAERRGWRVYFLGGTEQSVALAADRSRAKHPHLRLVGAYSPPFKPLLEMDHEAILRRISDAQPDLLLVAFGCPKQEKWINMQYRRAGVPVCIGVGATIDFLAGTFLRAPVWMQRSGTEWIYRMLQEPGRLVKRYGKDLWVFGRAIIPQLYRLRSRPAGPHPEAQTRTESEPSGLTVLRMPSHLDAAAAAGLQATADDLTRRGSILVDLRDTAFADSTGFGLLIRLFKRARANGFELVLASPQPALLTDLKLMQLDVLIPWAPTLDRARLLIANRLAPQVVQAGMQRGQLDLTWQGEITAVTVSQLEQESLRHFEGLPAGISVSVNLADVPFVDSSGVGLMVRLKKRARQLGFELVFEHPSPSVQNVVRLTRLEALLFRRQP